MTFGTVSFSNSLIIETRSSERASWRVAYLRLEHVNAWRHLQERKKNERQMISYCRSGAVGAGRPVGCATVGRRRRAVLFDFLIANFFNFSPKSDYDSGCLPLKDSLTLIKRRTSLRRRTADGRRRAEPFTLFTAFCGLLSTPSAHTPFYSHRISFHKASNTLMTPSRLLVASGGSPTLRDGEGVIETIIEREGEISPYFSRVREKANESESKRERKED
ncbi:hypothetical protein EVAR_52885_1 [Eumeta japonica]|uniref:Uncharacterized protein n=1 Tax=Eumeta variegata TaxID=151549 RepID=A0A4C1YML4_EUMVA|nr:hypothetical protein EVAR_52885_1 [Eumeta japonica]